MTTIYSNQLLQLNEEEKASAITAKHFTETDIQNFNIKSLPSKMDTTMPDLCALLKTLLNADQQLNKCNQLNAIHTVAQKTVQVFACFGKIVLVQNADIIQGPDLFIIKRTTY